MEKSLVFNWVYDFSTLSLEIIDAVFFTMLMVLASFVLFFPMGLTLIALDRIGLIDIRWIATLKFVGVAICYLAIRERFRKLSRLDMIMTGLLTNFGMAGSVVLFCVTIMGVVFAQAAGIGIIVVSHYVPMAPHFLK